MSIYAPMQTSVFIQSLQKHTYLKRKIPNFPTANIRRVSFHIPFTYGGGYLIAG